MCREVIFSLVVWRGWGWGLTVLVLKAFGQGGFDEEEEDDVAVIFPMVAASAATEAGVGVEFGFRFVEIAQPHFGHWV
jgi:hypothetical protein